MTATVYFLGTNDTTRQSAELLAGAMGHLVCNCVDESNFRAHFQADESACVVYNAAGRSLASCLEWSGEIIEEQPAVRIILLTHECETSDVVRAMRFGISSVLKFPFSFSDLEQAIESALQENERLINESRNRVAPEVAALLSRQEREIAQMLLDGAGTKQISVKLDLSIRTIHYRKKAILSKLGADARGDSLRALLSGDSRQNVSSN